MTVKPTRDTTYRVSCVGTGDSASDSVTVRVSNISESTARLSASPASITARQSSTLSWNSDNTESCSGSGFSTGGKTSGSVSVSPTRTTTYDISCIGAGSAGVARDSAKVTVTGGATANLSASPSSITAGQSSTLSWNATNVDSCTGTGFSTGGRISGSVAVKPTKNTSYSIRCEGAGGSASDGVTVSVGTDGGGCDCKQWPTCPGMYCAAEAGDACAKTCLKTVCQCTGASCWRIEPCN